MRHLGWAMIKNLGTIRLVFLGLFAVLTIASWTYSYMVVMPRQRCQAAGRWWSEQDRECGIPVSVSRFTGRPTPAEAAASRAATAGAQAARP